ncbi:MAG: metabolite traffic protein EboE [Planctomycetaceae bacterium]|nr:metabolite traffic protein EboE [Planctomycetaceae bacterium]
MSISPLPLSYCTNVHPGLTIPAVVQGLSQFTQPVQKEFGGAVAAGLWLAKPVIKELLSDQSALDRFANDLAALGLTCHTLNAFPYGDFHSDRVKDQVYLPDWSTRDRLDYTLGCAKVLARFLPEGGEGSISTLPLGFKGHRQAEDFRTQVIGQLVAMADSLDHLKRETGKTIRLAIEPEPFCLLETTPETLDFFRAVHAAAKDSSMGDRLRDYLGVCYDVCHQAVEFEEIGSSIRSLDDAGIRINKLHITCALQLDQPATNAEGRRTLATYAEPRYLHQTIGRKSNGDLLRFVDLTSDFANTPQTDWEQADLWRIHFHVPVNAEQIGPLKTTRPQLVEALQTIATLNYAPHLEVETYTWGVLPGKSQQRTNRELIQGLSNELRATRRLIEQISGNSA